MALIESNRARLAAFFAGLAVTVGFAAFMTVSMKHYLERPSNNDWRKINAFVAGQTKDGDLLAFFPAWLAGYARDWHRFEGLPAVSRKELLHPERLPTERVWVVSAFGDFGEGVLSRLGYALEQKRRIGRVDVYLFALSGRKVSFRLSDRLATVGVKWERYGETISPAWRDDRFDLPQARPIQAVSELFRYAPEKGVRVPATKYSKTTFECADFPAGKVVVCGGVTDQGLYSLEFAPIDVRVECGGQALGEVRFAGRSGWTCSDLGPRCAGGTARIAVTSDAGQKREGGFLFDLVVM